MQQSAIETVSWTLSILTLAVDTADTEVKEAYSHRHYIYDNVLLVSMVGTDVKSAAPQVVNRWRHAVFMSTTGGCIDTVMGPYSWTY